MVSENTVKQGLDVIYGDSRRIPLEKGEIMKLNRNAIISVTIGIAGLGFLGWLAWEKLSSGNAVAAQDQKLRIELAFPNQPEFRPITAQIASMVNYCGDPKFDLNTCLLWAKNLRESLDEIPSPTYQDHQTPYESDILGQNQEQAKAKIKELKGKKS